METPPPETNSRGGAARGPLLIALCGAVFIGACLAYANTLPGDWVWDDVSSVLLHEHVQDPQYFFQLFREDQHAFGRGQGNFYRPLVAATFMLDYWLSGGDPGAAATRAYPELSPLLFHVTNLLWHAAAALLLVAVLARMRTPGPVIAVAALLFTLHPLHTEAVAYISGRADMMSAAFLFAALFFALGAEDRRAPFSAAVLSSLCFAGGMLSKESSLIYPLLLGMFILLRPMPEAASGRRQLLLRRAAPLLPALVLVGAYAALRSTVLRFVEPVAGHEAPLGQRLIEVGQAFALYIHMLFWPTGLHMERSLEGTPAWLAIVGYALLLAMLVAFAAAARGGERRIALGIGWFLITWFPISGIFPLNAPLAEHWMYVPMAGFWWALGEAVWRATRAAPQWRPAAAAVSAALALLFLAMTIDRNRDWRDNESLFRATIAQNPKTLRVHYNLAVTYEDLRLNLAGARRHYEAVLERYAEEKAAAGHAPDALLPEEIEVRLALGEIHLRQGDYASAIAYFGPLAGMQGAEERIVADRARALFGLGRALIGQGDFHQGGRLLEQAAQTHSGYAEAFQAVLEGAPIV